MIRVVRLALAGERNDRAVMKVVVPHRIEAVTPGIDRPHELRGLRFALGDENDRTFPRRASGAAADLRDDVPPRSVVNTLRRIEPQAIELKLVNPVRGVAGEVLADWLRARAVEIQGIAPLVPVAARVVRLRVAPKHTSVGSEVVVDDGCVFGRNAKAYYSSSYWNE